MRGFAERVLVLLSSLDAFEESTSFYKYNYQMAIQNLISYFKSVKLAHDCLITDGLATRLNMWNPRWLATGAPEDLFFIQHYCSVPSYEMVPLDAEIISCIREKFPIQRGLSPAERFPLVAKRVKFAEQQLISSYHFIAVIGNEFTVKSTPEDGRAILRLSEKKFLTSMELSGTSVPINDFMQVPYANLCLNEWGNYSANK